MLFFLKQLINNVTINLNCSLIGYLLAIAAIIISYYCCNNIFNYWFNRAKLLKFALTLPGPPTLPFIGNALEFAVSAEDTLDKVVDLVRTNESTFRFWLGPKLIVVLSDPRDYEIILASSKASYKDPVYDLLGPVIGKGLVSALSIYLKCFNIHTRYCNELLKLKINSNDEFDILPFMTNCTSDMMLECIIGVQGTAQKGGYKQFVHYSDRIYELLHMRMMKVWLHPDFIFKRTKMGEEQEQALNIVHGLIDNVICRKKKEYMAIERGVIDRNELKVSLLDQLIDHAMKNKSMDDLELRYEIYTVYIAAQDTVAVIASFALLMLAIHQNIQDKLRKEIYDILGDDDDDDIDEIHIQKFKYLDMIIRETIRMYPIAPLMVRKTTGEIKLETCTLPENCSIVMAAYMTHRDKNHWIEPDKFNPDRFLSNFVKERHPYSFVGFSGGLRGCIGQKLAIMSLKTIIANVIRKYKLNTSQKLDDLKLKMDISIRSRCGYKINIKEIN
ncbi:hypothetical protein HCN44_009635 [Aphidius gifuensis]|uniref:Cytochrome P450 n=1 Tax=Aphidius gifuensis TaxID=684658 RepID=A0A835CW82_APHGI|nr:hypothetical protein HCN44_009635 [Aphidius gifuensis]